MSPSSKGGLAQLRARINALSTSRCSDCGSEVRREVCLGADRTSYPCSIERPSLDADVVLTEIDALAASPVPEPEGEGPWIPVTLREPRTWSTKPVPSTHERDSVEVVELADYQRLLEFARRAPVPSAPSGAADPAEGSEQR